MPQLLLSAPRGGLQVEESSEFVTEESESSRERRIRSQGWGEVVFVVSEGDEEEREGSVDRS